MGLFSRDVNETELEEARKERNDAINKLREYKCKFNSLVEQERKRIDKLIMDIESKFNNYMKSIEDKVIFDSKPVLKCSIIKDMCPADLSVIEFGEIKIRPICIRYIRGIND